MVYFGERRFKKTSSGAEAPEVRRVLVPVLILGGLVVILVVVAKYGLKDAKERRVQVHLPDRSPAASAPVGPAGDVETSKASPVGEDLPTPIGVVDPPEFAPFPDPQPFVTDDEVLREVRDGALDGEGKIIHEGLGSERRAIAYLLHRFRAGPQIPSTTELPKWPDAYRDRGDELRGKRFVLDLVIDEDALLEPLDPNPSGIDRYFDVFGHDEDQHIHRVIFAVRDRYFGMGDRVRVEADYLRLHMYQAGQVVSVPMWVAYRMGPAPAPTLALRWEPVAWVAVIGGVAILVVWGMVVLQGGLGGRPPRRFKMGANKS
ncbi:MAG: hypothetical protein KDC38_10910 [Planctomycetes bacterium]|nr:hypothetical protein [Planctomycetota bacterium]